VSIVKGMPLVEAKSRHAVTEQARGLRVSRFMAAVLECGHVRLYEPRNVDAKTMQCAVCAKEEAAKPDATLARQVALARELNAELERKLALQKQLNDAELERLTRPDPTPGDGGR
jgi:hypothetical protein